MIGIDIEMPNECNDCPCAYFTEGMSSDYCQINKRDFEEEQEEKIFNGRIGTGRYKRPIWCPLAELKGDNK